MPPLKDRELTGYAGVLFVGADALRELTPSGDGLLGAKIINGELLELLWHSGRRSLIDWRELREHAGLADLPLPLLAFVEHEEIILLFTSETPHPRLCFREPHSIVHCMGTLTASGLHNVSVSTEPP